MVYDQGNITDESLASPVLQAIRLTVYTGGFGLLVLLRNRLRYLQAACPFLVGLLLWAMLSTVWSIDRTSTIIRTYGLIGTTLLGVSIAAIFNLRQFLRLSLYSYLIIILISIAVCILLPDVGRHIGDSHDGAWRGAMGHKNMLGRVMVLGVALLYYAMKTLSGFEKNLARVCMGLAATLVLLSTSVTSLLVLLGLAGLLAALPLLKYLKEGAIPTVVIVMVILAMGIEVINLEAIILRVLDSTGRNLTFTGRTTIWSVSTFEWLRHNPFLGFGYGGFWGTNAGSRSISWGMGIFVPPSAHNGFLQVATELGVIGLGFSVGFLVYALKTTWHYMITTSQRAASLPFMSVVLLIVLNISEDGFLSQRNAIWMFVVILVTRAALENRLLGTVSKLYKGLSAPLLQPEKVGYGGQKNNPRISS